MKPEINQIFNAVFGRDCLYNFEQLCELFAKDLNLPKKVHDSTDNSETWSTLSSDYKFITSKNSDKIGETIDWMQKSAPENPEDIFKKWQDEINLITTERVFNSENVLESDAIYGSTNIRRSTDCGNSKNLAACVSCFNSEFCLACERTAASNFCIKVSDSNTCSNSYNVICSSKISNSLFIQDCSNLYECIFCAHISAQKYCILNHVLPPAEYYDLKSKIIDWIFNNFPL